MAQITKQQVIDLINQKIAGQGSAVDVGGALPAILKGLADMGISSDMSETEQMQARKDLGLYYEAQGPGVKTVKWTDEQEGPSNLWKISDDTPSKDDIVGVSSGGGDPTLDNYEMVDIDGGYVITLLNVDPKFQIILEETEGKTPGIYCTVSGKSVSLVYNGMVDVVSKVPEKYLPVAWNQLVTEGTKIAEVTIGEEKTDVFAPEGGGAYIAHASRDFYESAFVNLSTFFSNPDDITAVMSGNASVIEIDGTEIKYSFFGKKPGYVYYVSGNKILYLSGSGQYAATSFYEIVTGTIPGPLTLSGLPEATMTTQAELDAIGLTETVLNDIILGKYTGIKYEDMSTLTNIKRGFAQFKTVQFEGGTTNDKTIAFDMLGNNYNILIHSVTGVSTTITVTVTPLS